MDGKNRHDGYFTYVHSDDGIGIFTVVMKPEKNGRFPIIIFRSPYVDDYRGLPCDEIVRMNLEEFASWLDRGYAVIYQHCRGRGKSEGDCIPYINERRDGLALQAWLRQSDFYNGELYLYGKSYTAYVHYAVTPFAPDVKAAVLMVMDTERYGACYHNGFFKKALHGMWYVPMYKANSGLDKQYSFEKFDMLPLGGFTESVFGESAPDFDEMLRSPYPTDPFWSTETGGANERGALDHAGIPILLATSHGDIFTGGVFAMWRAMDDDTRSKSALLVSAYDHCDDCWDDTEIRFECASRGEYFGGEYAIDWFDEVRGIKKDTKMPRGKVTYYSLFEDKWKTDDFTQPETVMRIPLGEGERSYDYDPNSAPEFRGGLSRTFGGNSFQDPPGTKDDIITIYTEPFKRDTVVKGKMSASLCVRSDCEDTCFFVRVSIEKERGDYGLRDDINSLVYALGDYTPNTEVILPFEFDDHSFKVASGERLRVDIASADNGHFVRHTNTKGLYSEQTSVRTAHNTVILSKSYIDLPTE